MTEKSLCAEMSAAVTSHSEVMCASSKAASGLGDTWYKCMVEFLIGWKLLYGVQNIRSDDQH